MRMPSANEIASIVSDLVKRPGFACTVAVVVDGESQLFFHSYDRGPAGNPVAAALDGVTVLPLNEQTRFAIGSATATFTATHYAHQLSQDPELAAATLGEPAFRPIGAVPIGSNYAGISLHALAAGASRLPENPPLLPPGHESPYFVNELHNWLATNPFPLASSADSSLGYALLGHALAAREGREWLVSLQNAILTPLGIIGMEAHKTPPNQIAGCYRFDGSPYRIDYATAPASNPADALALSGADCLTWLRYNMGLLPRAGLNGLLAATQTGLGWKLTRQTVVRRGATQGYSSWFQFLRSSDPGVAPSRAGICILSNNGARGELGCYAYAIYSAIAEAKLAVAS